MIKCENCGYLVIHGMHICPNCAAEVVEPVEDFSPQIEEPSYNDEIPICTLRPLQKSGERPMREYEYDEGTEVLLARNNTVPADNTIDNEHQACLFFAQGHWFVEDRSQDQSTYVHAGAGIKLEPGDIIRMGTREFEFNLKTRKK